MSPAQEKSLNFADAHLAEAKNELRAIYPSVKQMPAEAKSIYDHICAAIKHLRSV